MSLDTHRNEILPIKNHSIPLQNTTSLYADFNHNLWGYDANGIVKNTGHINAVQLIGQSFPPPSPLFDLGVTIDKPINATGFTFEAWIKASTIGKNMSLANITVYDTGRRPPTYTVAMGIVAGKMLIGMGADMTTGTQPPAGKADILPDKWYHIALTVNGLLGSADTSMILYINGELVYSKTFLGNFITIRRAYIANQTPNINNFNNSWEGAISEVRLWSTVRTQQQIQGSMYKEADISDPTLSRYYKANEGRGNLVTPNTFDGSDIDIVTPFSQPSTWVQGTAVAKIVEDGKYGKAVQLTSDIKPALRYPGTVMNDKEGTISFWAKHTALPSTWVDNTRGYYFISNENHTAPYTSGSSEISYNGVNSICLYRPMRDDNMIMLDIMDGTRATDGTNRWSKTYNIKADLLWHHYVITWNKTSNKVSFYYDGELIASDTPTKWFDTFSNTKIISIGSGYIETGMNEPANIYMDELRIDKAAVSKDEVKSWYYANGPFIKPAGYGKLY